jgi:hypothetical protein
VSPSGKRGRRALASGSPTGGALARGDRRERVAGADVPQRTEHRERAAGGGERDALATAYALGAHSTRRRQIAGCRVELDRMERPGVSGCSVRLAGGLRICVGCRV